MSCLMFMPDAQLPLSTSEESYLSVACADVYLCQRHIKLTAV